MVMFFLILALVFVVLLVIITNIVIVPQSKVYVVERLGSYSDTWSAGLHIKIPFIERIAKKVSLKEQVADFPPQPVITRDNVTMQIDTVVFFQVMDAKLYTYGVNQPIAAIESLSATTLRNIIGEMELDQSLTSRDVINAKMRSILDEATDPWGIKVNRVELKNILPPREIQNAMEKQMKAERERRESILQAEGQKASQILVAEGEQQSAILRADAAKQAKIMAAEAEAQSIVRLHRLAIEGGDVLVLSKDIVAIGLSERTTVSGAETFARNLLQNSDFKKVLAFDIPETRAFMHLDTVFTMVDYDKFTIHPEIEGPLSVYEMTLDEHGELRFGAIKEELKDILALELKLPAVDLIRCGGGDLMAAQREQWNDGSNTLCIAPGRVITYERNYVTNDLLAKHGLDVLTVPSAELSRGRGGPRCMSCPVNRDDL